jgi:hypothetical protein
MSIQDFEGVRFQRIAHIRHLVKTGTLGNDLRRGESMPRRTARMAAVH